MKITKVLGSLVKSNDPTRCSRSSTRESFKLVVLEDLKNKIPTKCIGVVLAKNSPKVRSETHNNL